MLQATRRISILHDESNYYWSMPLYDRYNLFHTTTYHSGIILVVQRLHDAVSTFHRINI